MGKNPLGRGLASLLGEKGQEEIVNNTLVKDIPVAKILPNPFQPRRIFSEEEIQELAESISRSGLLQPLVVRQMRGKDNFELIAGERRLRAVKLLGWETVPAVVREVDVQEMALFALVENIQRKDISPIEEARTYRLLMEKFSLTQEEVARLVSKSRSRIANALRLLSLPEEVQEKIAKGEISFSQAREILSGNPDAEEIRRRAKMVASSKMTVREIRKEKDPFSCRVEETFQQLLGTKVRIEHNDRKKSGKIIIEYYSLADLDRIINLIREGRRQTNASSFGVN